MEKVTNPQVVESIVVIVEKNAFLNMEGSSDSSYGFRIAEKRMKVAERKWHF